MRPGRRSRALGSCRPAAGVALRDVADLDRLDGGLGEKDLLALQGLEFEELLRPVEHFADGARHGHDELAFEAIASVDPGGHFFGCEHTMARYQTAFYQPLVSDWSNFGTWTENGALTATQRANQIWKELLKIYEKPPMDPAVDEALQAYVAKRKEEIERDPESMA